MLSMSAWCTMPSSLPASLQVSMMTKRSGVPATLNEEIQILSDAVQAMVFLSFLRVIIHTFGPFAFSGAARNAQGMVEKMSYTSAHVLERLPQHGWPEIERNGHKGLA